MKAIERSAPIFLLAIVVLTSDVTSLQGQEVSVPDPGLNAAIARHCTKPAAR